MSSVVKTNSGKKIVLLNPAEKGKRYSRQLRNGCVSETGEVLTDSGKSFRRGDLTARRDNAEAYCAKNGIPSKSKERRKAYVKSKRNNKK